MLHMTRLAASLSMALGLVSTSAQSQASPESSPPHTALGIREVLHRVESLDPQLRLKAAEQMQAEVARRRAEWNRARGAIGVQGGHAFGLNGIGATQGDGVHGQDYLRAVAYADFRLPIYAGGAIQSAIDAALAREEASRNDTDLVRQELKRAALLSYAQVIAAQQLVHVANRACERADGLIGLASSRRDSGVGSQADVARSRLHSLRLEEDRISKQTDQDIAAALLHAALLLPPGSPVEPSESLQTLAHYQGQGTGVYPELRSLQAALDATRSDAAAARAGYLPTVELFAQGQYGNGGFSLSPAGLGSVPVAQPPNDRWSSLQGNAAVGIVAGWKAFDMFVTRDLVARSDLSVAAASARLSDAERSVRSAREQATAREAQSTRRMELLAGGEQTAAEAVSLARARYETGNAILTEVIDAELEAIGIESRKVQAGWDLAVAHLDRLRAEGSRL